MCCAVPCCCSFGWSRPSIFHSLCTARALPPHPLSLRVSQSVEWCVCCCIASILIWTGFNHFARCIVWYTNKRTTAAAAAMFAFPEQFIPKNTFTTTKCAVIFHGMKMIMTNIFFVQQHTSAGERSRFLCAVNVLRTFCCFKQRLKFKNFDAESKRHFHSFPIHPSQNHSHMTAVCGLSLPPSRAHTHTLARFSLLATKNAVRTQQFYLILIWTQEAAMCVIFCFYSATILSNLVAVVVCSVFFSYTFVMMMMK